MKRNVNILVILLLGAVLTPARADLVELWAVFDQASPAGTFSAIDIPLSTGSWRIGDISGPVANNALIFSVLSNLIEIRVGGLGSGLLLDGSFEPFGFSLADPILGGASEGFTGGDAAGFSIFGPSTFGPSNPGGRITVRSGEITADTFIGFVFSSLFLGNQSAAFGTSFSFRWAAEPGIFVDPPYVYENGGRVILTGRLQGEAVPEPGTFVSAASALVVVAFVSARRRQHGNKAL